MDRSPLIPIFQDLSHPYFYLTRYLGIFALRRSEKSRFFRLIRRNGLYGFSSKCYHRAFCVNRCLLHCASQVSNNHQHLSLLLVDILSTATLTSFSDYLTLVLSNISPSSLVLIIKSIFSTVVIEFLCCLL